MHVARPSIFAGMLALAAGVLLCLSAQAQTCPASLEKVMTLMWTKSLARTLPQDQGAVGLWQKLQKLQTTASVLHTVAHPDDEHAGMLTYLSRGAGARVALLSLSRGDSSPSGIHVAVISPGRLMWILQHLCQDGRRGRHCCSDCSG